MKKYEAPRAVRLSDACKAVLACTTGPYGTANTCESGNSANYNLCQNGPSVT
jgi:hypothetical protein